MITEKLSLPQVTLIVADTYNYGLAVASLQKSMGKVNFGAVKFLTDIPIELDGIEVVQIPTMRSKEDYSKFIIKELYKYFDTDYVLITQHDSWVLDVGGWQDRFLDYDYIGSPWLYPDNRNVGNGGFSIRSKKLQTILGTDDKIEMYSPEDEIIARLYRQYLEEKHWIKYPTEEVADEFSFELREPKCPTFGFHGYFHRPYTKTIILKRSAALGDIIIMEPIMRYYAVKGWNVVLDIPLEFFPIFNNHYFPVKHISTFDKGRIKAEREINFDLCYEVKPRQNYLKSYFEFAGITDYDLTRQQLYPLVDDRTRIFKKYAVIHIDNRATPERNPIGIDWKKVQRHLESLGYTVIQVGANDAEPCGLKINTTNNLGLLKFIIGGSSLFIGVDSSPAHIATGYNIPSVLLFGSTCPDYIHADLTNVEVIQGLCDKAYCWHQEGATAGKKCVYANTDKYLQCCKMSWEQINDSINKLHK